MSQIATFDVVDRTVRFDSPEPPAKATHGGLRSIFRFGRKPEAALVPDPRVRSSREFESNGNVIAVLAEFLRTHDGLDVLCNDDVSLENTLKHSDAVTFSYSPTRSFELAGQLAARVPDRDALTAYWREFNEVDEPEAGHWMLAAHDWLHSALLDVQPGTVGVLSIG
jgi:hypothetical protein